jgi:hypothetical protein
MWDFDATKVQLVFKLLPESIPEQSLLDLGQGGDLAIDVGSRENTLSEIDQGNRVSGNI